MTEQRRAARIIMRDKQGRVLLFQHVGSNAALFWAPPGGALEGDETYEKAALREALEELGIRDATLRFLWEGTAEFTYRGELVHQFERFFLVEGAVPDFNAEVLGVHQREGITDARWWTITELKTAGEPVFPEELVARLREIPNGPA